MVGIDVDIERVRQHFETNLWADKNCEFYGRVYPNEKADGIIPEVHISGTDRYKEVLLDRKLDCIAFFYVDSNRELLNADVSIIFAINVKSIYSAYSTRETERAMRDAKLNLDNSGVAFNVENVVTGIDAVDEFTFTNQNKMDIHPFYLFRFDCESNYDFNAPCDYENDSYVLTMSSDNETQGLTLPAIGAHTYKEGTVVTGYPVPKTGFEWNGTWLIDGVVVTTENPTITMTANKVAKAFYNAVINYAFTNVLLNGYGDVDPNNGEYRKDTEMILDCTVDNRFIFKEWSINGDVQTSNPYTFNITEDTDVTAELTPKAEYLQFPSNTLNLTEVLDLDKILAL